MNANDHDDSGHGLAGASTGWALRRHFLLLGALALVAALVLVLVHRGTAERSERQREQVEREALLAVLPPTTHDNDLLNAAFVIDPQTTDLMNVELLGLTTARPAYLATLQGRPSGVILPVETAGYGGALRLLVGISSSGQITGVRVLEHQETPGLGDAIELQASNWILGFNNRSLANTPAVLWQVKQDGGEFDQFVGATLTPRAVVAAVYAALQFFELNQAALLAAQAGAAR